MGEFSLIETYFKPLTRGRAEAGALQSDTALLDVPAGQQLVMSTDTLNEGVHFFAGTPPEIIAQKLLRSNLSDIAAGGADPYCYQLAVAFPALPDHAWLDAFSQSLLADQQRADLFCSGGDTTSTIGQGASFTITMIGIVPSGQHVTRAGAQDGDVLIVTGTIGQGGQAYQQKRTIAPPFYKGLGALVRRYAHAAVDISDGLLADSAHIAQASGLSLQISYEDIPIIGADRAYALSAGDDYELILSVPAAQAQPCLRALQGLGCAPAIIGSCTKGAARLSLYGADGQEIRAPEKAGWQHF